MKRCAGLVAAMVVLVTTAWAQYPLRTIRELQQVPVDSLRILDTLQRTQLGRWTLQRSPFYPETVRVRGVCVVPAKVINFTANGFNLLLADTASRSEWGGLLVRPPLSTGSPDTTLYIQWGIANIEVGDYVELTGYIDEFPSGDPVSATQIVPLRTFPLTILGTAPVPPHVPKLTSDFYKGNFPGTGPNGIQFSTGEPMEFMRVRLTNLTVVSYLNATNGTLNLLDQFNNAISTMDASKWFTLRGYRDPASTYVLPPINTRIDTIWGYMLTNSGQEAPRGYRIAPLNPGDIKYGVALPIVNTHRRNPIIVAPDSTPVVSVRVTQGGTGISAIQLRYSVNAGGFVTTPMTLNASDTTYRASIPQQAANTNVRYYINVIDSLGNTVRLASSATDGSQTDTLRGFFFFNVLNRAVTIRDIQETPFPNGRSPYIGARVTVSGLITADTASLVLPPTRFRGTNVWYLQSGNQPWSGIWLHSDSLSNQLLALKNGDSVSITGTVAEDFDVTRLQVLSTPTVHSSNNPLPPPIELTTNTFGAGAGNGTPTAERWEGMLVQFNNVTLSDSTPTFQEIYEFGVNDGSGQVLIRRDGKHQYTTTALDPTPGLVLIRQGQRISHLRGVVYYSGNYYKIAPRANPDFGTISSVNIDRGAGVPNSYTLGQNYPNPFNPTTTIQFNLPKTEFATIQVYNILGQKVETLLNREQEAGTYTLHFNASHLPSGVYFYRLQAGGFAQTKRMILVK
ncbi:MAG: T9SS type A sorting domain-containing protein [Ignavibacteriae bacterium]|nr:T9SS type A sorting domain-containing protein [Ignavibacteriota bacterium]